MIVGALGDIVFEVSEETAMTLSNMTWGGSAQYATHQRLGTHAMTEYVGINADTISFDIVLSAYLGLDPQTVINQIFAYERSGTTLPLVIGNKAFGKYRWVITKHNAKPQFFDAAGISHCAVSLNLQEYINWNG